MCLLVLSSVSPIFLFITTLYWQDPQELSADPGEPRRGPVPDRTRARVVRTDLLRRPAVPDLPGPRLFHGKGENLSTDSSYLSTGSFILNQRHYGVLISSLAFGVTNFHLTLK